MSALRSLMLFVLALSVTGPAGAQEGGRDYYAGRGTELLRNVDKYHLAQGEQKLRARQYEYAFGDFDFMLSYFPNHPKALLNMAQLCGEWKAPRCNLDVTFENAIAVNPRAAGTYVVQGIWLSRVKRNKAAIDAFKAALALEPDSMNAHYNLALTYFDERDFALANEHAQRAYALGAPVMGLRQKLEKVGQWRPLPAPDAGAAPDARAAPAARAP
jgi:tetratricopeptide (TPR) repeat protein